MDLTAWLLRHTPPRPLLVPVPGGTAARLAVERVVRERGWPPAGSPAEANILVVAGVPENTLESSLRRVWNSMPAPRVRADIADPGETARQLDSALNVLRDVVRQREQAADRRDHHDAGGHESRHGIPATEHENHHGHHMGGMDMPGGIPMADRSADRDGLKLDQLHIPLGPALPLWPAGLVVHTRLQGDVIQQATVELLGSGRDSFWAPSGEAGAQRLVARRLDSSARLLALAGWVDPSVVAQRLRDAALTGATPAELRPPLQRWARRVGRSRTLRWLLTGLGSTPDDPATPQQLAGDALARLRRWLDTALALENAAGMFPDRHETQWTVDNLPALLQGTELATARLVVASLDPDLDLLAHHEAHHD